MTHLFMPLQQDGAAVIRRFLEPSVDVLHQQIHSILIQRLHSRLNVIALKGGENTQDHSLGTLLRGGGGGGGEDRTKER